MQPESAIRAVPFKAVSDFQHGEHSFPARDEFRYSPNHFVTKKEKILVDKTEIIIRNNGPIRLVGDFVIKDIDGNELDIGGRREISLCRCGHSSKKPFCDGTHKKMEFRSEIKASEIPPLPAPIPPAL